MHFGEKIKTLRETKQLTRGKLSDVLGIKYSTLSNYENGVRQPDFDTLKMIAKFFCVSTDYLLEEDEDRKRQLDSEIISMIERIDQKEEIKILIDESQKVSPEDLKIVINLLRRMNSGKL